LGAYAAGVEHASTAKAEGVLRSMNVSRKREYKRLFADVRAILNRHDPMALLAMGAPDDEYEPEVAAILPRLSRARGPADVEAIIADEFLRWFDERLPRETVSVVAADVWGAYVRFRDSARSG
jgi:hypothetical protein